MKTLFGVVLTAAGMLAGAAFADGPDESGVAISAAQAKRGEALYGEFCRKCHGDRLNNGQFGPPIRGKFFRDLWKGKTVGALFTLTVKTMPPTEPGFLTDQEYADVTAYILEANGLEPGGGELPGEPEKLQSMPLPW